MASNSQDLFARVGSHGAQADTMSLDEADNQDRLEEETDKTRRERDSDTRRLPWTHSWPARSLDPMQCLPLEISTFIIYEALPEDEDYPNRLLEFTTVSQIWHGTLLSTPILWSELYLNDRKSDFLATVATCVHLSGNVALKAAIYDLPMYDWPSLSSILLPVCDRIVSLSILPGRSPDPSSPSGISRGCTAAYMFLHYLSPLQRLKQLAFAYPARIHDVSVFDKLNLPPSMCLTGELVLPMPGRSLSSETPGRFFNIDKYCTLATTPVVVPLFQYCSLSLGWLGRSDTTVRMKGDTLSQIKHHINYLRENLFPTASPSSYDSSSQPTSVAAILVVDSYAVEGSLERLTRIIGTSLCSLGVTVSISQVNDLFQFVQLLGHLQTLDLEIILPEEEFSIEIPIINAVVYGLHKLTVRLENYRKHRAIWRAQKTLQNFFSVLSSLYPGVTRLKLWVDTWPFPTASYLERLTELKNLYIILDDPRYGSQYDTRYDPEDYSITLGTLEELGVMGPPLLHYLQMPNLLYLSLDHTTCDAGLGNLDLSSLRKLTVHSDRGWSYNIDSRDYPVMHEIDLRGYEVLKHVDILSFSSLYSIRLETHQFTNPEGNHLCLLLLCNPEGCPSLQELHCESSLEWDILVLMLERRNFGLKGVKRIHTVTLPFVSNAIRQPLDLLLAGENAERPPLESISLEATREVLFDPTIPGCCWCLKNMVPRCKHQVYEYDEYDEEDFDLCQWIADELYPEHDYRLDALPSDVRDWMVHRKNLVDAWKSSYKEFSQDFARWEICSSGLYYGIQ